MMFTGESVAPVSEVMEYSEGVKTGLGGLY